MILWVILSMLLVTGGYPIAKDIRGLIKKRRNMPVMFGGSGGYSERAEPYFTRDTEPVEARTFGFSKDVR